MGDRQKALLHVKHFALAFCILTFAVNTIALYSSVCAYVHIDVVVKSSELSSVHEDVKFKFIRLSGVAAQKLDMKIMYIKTIIKAYVMN
jgi:hypothetical protein